MSGTQGSIRPPLFSGSLDEVPMPADQSALLAAGTTLTAAFVVKGIIDATALLGIDIESANLLVLDPTDIGIACARFFKQDVQHLFLIDCLEADRRWPHEFNDSRCTTRVNANDVLPKADIIIRSGCSTDVRWTATKRGTLVADAGHPKNILSGNLPAGTHLFYAGMGMVSENSKALPTRTLMPEKVPGPRVAHGNILASAIEVFHVMDGHWTNDSITTQKIEEALVFAEHYGVESAPFFNDEGLWPNQAG